MVFNYENLTYEDTKENLWETTHAIDELNMRSAFWRIVALKPSRIRADFVHTPQYEGKEGTVALTKALAEAGYTVGTGGKNELEVFIVSGREITSFWPKQKKYETKPADIGKSNEEETAAA